MWDPPASIRFKPWWWIVWFAGMLASHVIEELLNMLALFYAPSALVTPMVGAHIVMAVLFSFLFLGENLSLRSIVCVCCCALGVIVCALSAPDHSDEENAIKDRIQQSLADPPTVAYISGVLAFMALLLILPWLVGPPPSHHTNAHTPTPVSTLTLGTLSSGGLCDDSNNDNHDSNPHDSSNHDLSNHDSNHNPGAADKHADKHPPSADHPAEMMPEANRREPLFGILSPSEAASSGHRWPVLDLLSFVSSSLKFTPPLKLSRNPTVYLTPPPSAVTRQGEDADERSRKSTQSHLKDYSETKHVCRYVHAVLETLRSPSSPPPSRFTSSAPRRLKEGRLSWRRKGSVRGGAMKALARFNCCILGGLLGGLCQITSRFVVIAVSSNSILEWVSLAVGLVYALELLVAIHLFNVSLRTMSSNVVVPVNNAIYLITAELGSLIVFKEQPVHPAPYLMSILAIVAATSGLFLVEGLGTTNASSAPNIRRRY